MAAATSSSSSVALADLESWASHAETLMLLDRFPHIKTARREVGERTFVPSLDTAVDGTVHEFVPAMTPLLPQLEHEPLTFDQQPEADDALNRRVFLWTGDIARLAVTAVTVPAVSSTLPQHGGLARAIRKAAGGSVVDDAFAAATKDRVPLVGDVTVTPGGALPAAHIIHTVLPTKHEAVDQVVGSRYLQACYQNALAALLALPVDSVKSIAFCCLGTGQYSCEMDQVLAAHCALASVRAWLTGNKLADVRVVFCMHDARQQEIYEQLMRKYFPCPA